MHQIYFINKLDELIITGVISTISALVVFFLSETVKKIRNDKMLFKKLEVQLYQTLILLQQIESSCKQYKKLLNNYKLKDIGSIGFPNYSFTYLENIIPTILYNKTGNLFLEITNIYNIIFNLNNNLINLNINKIQNDLLSNKVSLEVSEKRYHQEIKYIESIYETIPQYINLVKRVFAKIRLINRHKQFFILNDISIKINFPKNKVNKEIDTITEIFQRDYKKIEDITT